MALDTSFRIEIGESLVRSFRIVVYEELMCGDVDFFFYEQWTHASEMLTSTTRTFAFWKRLNKCVLQRWFNKKNDTMSNTSLCGDK